MTLLNPGYSLIKNNLKVETGLYYNAKSGTCFSGQNNATTSCSFTSTGIKMILQEI